MIGMTDVHAECAGVEIEGEIPRPCALVIFGASGDLTRRKLIPALYNLNRCNILPNQFSVVGVARREVSAEVFRQQLKNELESSDCGIDAEAWEAFSRHLYYLPGDLNHPTTYHKLKELLARTSLEHGAQDNLLFYLSVAPDSFIEVVRQIDASGLAREEPGRGRRVIFEKPFGRDLDSARALNTEIKKALGERQIYRIDHYLGKATVQNIMAFRFANGIFEPIWDRRYIDHVEITAAETMGVENRAGYYESAGALRDMVPNHLFQLLSLIAMECPVSFDADAVRDEQSKVLHGIQPIEPEEVLSSAVRGQYGEGMETGKRVPGYRDEPGVAHDSRTETYVALRLMIDNWRWAGVPFYLRTGKRLAQRVTEISIQFRRPPFQLFRETPVEKLRSNQLVINIQPDEGISLGFQAKVPGGLMKLDTVDMTFKYADYFGEARTTGYERLIYDAMCGDATLFQRADMVEAGWKVISPVQDVWSSLNPRLFPNYAAGTWGPEEATELLRRDGRKWRKIG
jgi:glucose-6-phosphate 1-dehydrogenase